MGRLIDADALKENIRWCKEQGSSYDTYWDDILERIDVQPTIEAEPVRSGRWEYHLMPLAKKCSLCGERVQGKSTWTFCPNCGARMEEG